MKFVVVTYGTEGDTRPLAALCQALMDAGHETRLLADGATLGVADALGVPTTALAGDIKRILQTGNIVSKARGGGGFTNTAIAFARIAKANTEAWMRDIVASANGCDAIIVSGLAAFAGLSVAEYLGVRAIGASLIPITPTSAFPSPFLRPGVVPGWLNRASHRLINWMLWRAFRQATNAARESVFRLPPRKAVWTGHPMLYGLSRSLLPRPEDWPRNAYVCGQWIPPIQSWSPPQSLHDFLIAGEPPLYIGFGSMAGFDRRKLLREMIAAIAGRRALFYPGWSDIDVADLPGNFFAVGDTPHSWLFPRTSLVIHHGGAGTTHSAVRAGVPSVVVPFAADQFFWADRLQRAGAAPAPVNAKNLRAAALAQGIEFAEGPGARSHATALGAEMTRENGLTDAVAVVESLIAA
jgi:sterol 3beta-glucosyltransferase